MLISHTHKFIFFHVAKTGGMSIRQVLQPYSQEPDTFKLKRPAQAVNGQPNPLYEMWESLLWHAKAKDAQKYLPTAIFEQYYKFAFVRNPWDWQVSMYHFILKEADHVKREFVENMTDFEEYLEWVIATKTPYPKGATKLQQDMLVDKSNQLLVDYVGRYETLADDFNQVCRRLQLEATLPHINKSQHRDYRSYYNDRTRQLVADYFQADIALFGYRFDQEIKIF